MGVIGVISSLIGFVAAVAAASFWIWTLTECLTKEQSVGNDKLTWAIVIIFMNAIGALLYFFVRRPTRIRVLGQ